MKANFRLNFKHDQDVMRKSINDFKNDAVKGIAEKLIKSGDEFGGDWGRWMNSWGNSWGRVIEMV